MNEKLLNLIDLDKFTELSDRIVKERGVTEEEAEEHILSLGPKRLRAIGVLEDKFGWRDGYTKQSLKKRTENRRKKNKQAKKARRVNR